MRRIGPDPEHPVHQIATGSELVGDPSERLPDETQLLIPQQPTVLEEHQPCVHRGGLRELLEVVAVESDDDSILIECTGEHLGVGGL